MFSANKKTCFDVLNLGYHISDCCIGSTGMATNPQFTGIQPSRPSIAPQGAPQTALPSMAMQVVPAQQAQTYMAVTSQQFIPVGLPNIGMPVQQPHFSQPIQQLASRPGVPHIPPLPTQQILVPDSLPHHHGLDGPRLPGPPPYVDYISHRSDHKKNVTWPSERLQSVTTPMQQTDGQSSVYDIVPATISQPDPVVKGRSDWIAHTARNGKRYYYNKRTKFSSWEKPVELMTAMERADATTDWSEITSPDGRKYYYNKVTKQSKWAIPDELKVAREQVIAESNMSIEESIKAVNFYSPDAVTPPPANGSVGSSPVQMESAVAMEPVGPTSGSANLLLEASSMTANAHPVESVTTTNQPDNVLVAKDAVTAADGISVFADDTVEARKVTSTVDVAIEEKTIEQEPLVNENKQEAKSAFLSLLESSNIASDWTWDQTMRVIINDRRYGALKTLGERKQAFNEFLVQKKKKDAEERRLKQKKAKEDFRKMLEESKELSSSSRWSKSITIFEDDVRYIAVERAKDREDLFEDYVLELERKERAKAVEEHKRNRLEYIEYMQSCDFITASSQWRKIQERLEGDERCSRLKKIDRLEIFQEYIRELEKEEEEQRKLWMEEVRRAERKNRDEFRKLMEEHIAAGSLSVKTHWRDYCMKVKELPAYIAVASNTSGATPKDLFEDVAEELQKQHVEDKDRVTHAVKLGKITVSSSYTLDDFKAAISEHLNSSTLVLDANIKHVFDELQEKAREKEEKEFKRRKRQADEFYAFLSNFKDINASSEWESCKAQLEDREDIRFGEDESFFKDVFENYVDELKERARQKERRRREEKEEREREEKRKQRREKEKGKERHRKDETAIRENSIDKGHNSSRKRGHTRSSFENLSFIEDDNRSKSFHRHSIDRKRPKQLEQVGHEGEYESRNKRQKRDVRFFQRNMNDGDHEDRDGVEDGEVW